MEWGRILVLGALDRSSASMWQNTTPGAVHRSSVGVKQNTDIEAVDWSPGQGNKETYLSERRGPGLSGLCLCGIHNRPIFRNFIV
jgi:hypothetical protein